MDEARFGEMIGLTGWITLRFRLTGRIDGCYPCVGGKAFNESCRSEDLRLHLFRVESRAIPSSLPADIGCPFAVRSSPLSSPKTAIVLKMDFLGERFRRCRRIDKFTAQG